MWDIEKWKPNTISGSNTVNGIGEKANNILWAQIYQYNITEEQENCLLISVIRIN